MALLLPRSNSVFLHIPKTGGTWFRHAAYGSGIELVETGEQHGAVQVLLKEGRGEQWLSEQRIFTIVRHPVTWYQSRWCFRVKYGWHVEHPLDMSCASNDFHTFVDNVLKQHPNGWLSKLYKRYNECPVHPADFVARTENIVDDLVGFLKQIGEEFDETAFRTHRRLNESMLEDLPSSYWAKYTPQLLDRVLAVESEAIEKYYPDFELNRDSYIGDLPYA